MSWQIKVENISKLYRLGEVGTGTLSQDINRWYHKIRGKEDPYSKVGQVNDRSVEGDSDFVWALKDINFQVDQGEVLGIIGRNGAGKSTLLKILSQITSPTTGVIKTKGRIASLLEVGTGMHPEMTARDNIYLNGAILGMTKKEIRLKFDEIVAFSGCVKYIDTPLKRFSSGMRVRLGFAVAAFLEPEILIVDEVLAVGDAEFQQKAIGKMKDISKSGGRTVLFVSHNMAAVKSLCTRAILMENGTISSTGTPNEIVEQYIKVNTSNYQLEAIHPTIDLNSNRKWDIIFMKSAKVYSDNFFIDDPLTLEFKFDLNDSNQKSLSVAVDFLNLEDEIVFGSYFKIDVNDKKQIEVKCVVPANLFNDIAYYVNFYIFDQKVKAIYGFQKILLFKMEENKRDSLFFGKVNGLLRPKIDWFIEEN